MATRKRGGYPSKAGHRKKRTEVTTKYLIVAEGSLTEPQYFELLKPLIFEKFAVQWIIKPNLQKGKSPSGNWKSDPESVVRKCVEFREKENKKSSGNHKDTLPYSRCFAVVDYDEWDKGTKPTPLDRAISLARNEEINLIINHLKFEAWLVWHHESEFPKTESTKLSKQAERLKYIDGKNLLPSFPIHRFNEACKRAEKRHATKIGNKGPNPSTAMPQLFMLTKSDSPL